MNVANELTAHLSSEAHGNQKTFKNRLIDFY